MRETVDNPFDPSLQRYWDKRYQLFSRFDEGIRIDEEGLFSVKPETIALQIASHVPEQYVLDSMCGSGGSAIAFARLGKKVVAADRNPDRVAMARTNAAIYDVSDRITFSEADALSWSATDIPCGHAVYLDPPWGGPDYHKLDRFTLNDFSVPMRDYIGQLTSRGIHTILTVPANFDMRDVMEFGRMASVLHSYDDKRRIFSTIFFR